MDILKKIDDLLKIKGWSQYKLALEAGLTQSTLSNMYSRGTLPSITTLKNICDALDISLAQFFDEGESALSPDEFELLSNYRKLSVKNKNAVKKLCKNLI
ncbi:MAG: helix-turn-helix transcriptional regulator [Clostridia bacterium]|nr:helix-turn-helix transcriptional regulator [Clostridia bacterium]